ncbi:alpha-L-fucosidase [Bacteroides sp.]|uniref:alpha-L-fucosidase n=1 Tax=Bacteroides sp. TaxID=29523 RepID=UPI00261E0EE1|nr:alpha-L-fucosidase [Bacteroides sp.]
MKKFGLIFLGLGILFVFSSCVSRKEILKSDYQENWESLSAHKATPDWLYDAKFGIYFHWGIYTVPAFGSEWYPRFMFQEGTGNYAYHKEHFGDPAKFGYHDFIPLFKAEHFNADEWVDLFEKAGARFAGPCSEHCDGFSMWASKINPWNSMDMGPHRDVTGELKKALNKRNMKMIATFHHAWHLQSFNPDKPDQRDFDSSYYPFIEGMPTTSEDSLLKIFYGNVPLEEWAEKYWFGKLKEVIDAYEPDIIWHDSALGRVPEKWRVKFCAYYINEMARKGKEAAIVRKGDIPVSMSIENYEKSRKTTGNDRPWMADETISTNSWSYVNDMVIRPSADLIHILSDIVSKNGILLLNISPKADGTIPQDQSEVLLEIGAWLKKYGEAIYSTRPWYTYGEGPTKEPDGGFGDWEKFLKLKYTTDDIRYTTKDNTIYIIIQGNPETGKQYNLASFASQNLPKAVDIEEITLLGNKENVTWKHTSDGLTLTVPEHDSKDGSIVFKVEVN